MVITVTEENFEAEVLQSPVPVLVDFWAPWCGPCRMVAPIVERLAAELENVKIGKVNVDDAPALAERYGVMSIPMFLVFKNGEVTQSAVGVQGFDALKALL
ncbi:MAG: thioredoxin [Clostridia bacterium]|nr:thioredoxin [Clostridia bacterium]